MKKLFIFVILICWFSLSSATVIYIPEEYSTIPEAIEVSIDGDTVMVGPGVYHEEIRFFGKGILLSSRFGPDSTEVGLVRIQDGEDSTTILRGFKIYSGDAWTRALRAYNVNNPIIEGNLITENRFGIAINNIVIVRNNIITHMYCYGSEGGGARIREASLLTENIISDNRNFIAEDNLPARGGGVFIADSATCSFNLIVNNTAEDLFYDAGAYGGGIYGMGSPRIINNTIVGNRAIVFGLSWWGGGVYLNYLQNAVLVNNIIVGNTMGGGIEVSTTVGNTFNYNDIWGNHPYDYNENYTPGDGDIFENPLFVNPDSGDYSLQEDSPCIDAGDPNSPLDPDFTLADIGCYYYDHRVDVLEQDSSNSPHKFYLEQNYPNPFNGQTIISYYLLEDSDVELNIINMRGELVAKPVNSHQSVGNHSLIWQGTRKDGTPVATGIYFYELKVSNPHAPHSI